MRGGPRQTPLNGLTGLTNGPPSWSFCGLNEAISDTEVQNWLLYNRLQAFRNILLAPATRCENMQPHLFFRFFRFFSN